jgi:hypothetical protein
MPTGNPSESSQGIRMIGTRHLDFTHLHSRWGSCLEDSRKKERVRCGASVNGVARFFICGRTRSGLSWRFSSQFCGTFAGQRTAIPGTLARLPAFRDHD